MCLRAGGRKAGVTLQDREKTPGGLSNRAGSLWEVGWAPGGWQSSGYDSRGSKTLQTDSHIYIYVWASPSPESADGMSTKEWRRFQKKTRFSASQVT